MVDNPSSRQWMSFQRRAFGIRAIGQLYHAFPRAGPGSPLGRIAADGPGAGRLGPPVRHMLRSEFSSDCPDLHQLRGSCADWMSSMASPRTMLCAALGENARACPANGRCPAPPRVCRATRRVAFLRRCAVPECDGPPPATQAEGAQGCVGVPVVQAPAGGAIWAPSCSSWSLPLALGKHLPGPLPGKVSRVAVGLAGRASDSAAISGPARAVACRHPLAADFGGSGASAPALRASA